MDSSHLNVLVTSCLKTPVALYERDGAVVRVLDISDHEAGLKYESGPDVGSDRDSRAINSVPPLIKEHGAWGHDGDLCELQLSNEEYYCKLAQLKKAHICSMAELEHTFHVSLQIRDVPATARDKQLQWGGASLVLPGKLKKADSAHDLRRDSTFLGTDAKCESDRHHGDYSCPDMKTGLLNSAKKHIKNMWQDFSVYPQQRHPSSASLLNHAENHRVTLQPEVKVRGQRSRKPQQVKVRRRRATVPEPFRMTLREAERKRKSRSRSELEWEKEKLRRQMEELAECQHKFRAGPVPAHVHLPLFEELQERRHLRAMANRRLRTTQRPFGFLERERVRVEQKEARLREQALLCTEEEEEWRRRAFRARPVPRAVKEAASGERQKEEELYRAIRMQMRAREMLQSASLPPSTLAGRLAGRRARRASGGQADAPRQWHRTCGEVPDFDGSYRHFQKRLARRRDVRPVTVCEPFQLHTANVALRRQRTVARVEADGRLLIAPATPSPRSSQSVTQDYLPSKITHSAKKRQEAVRKVLEQRRKAEEEEERWRRKQKKVVQKLQKVIWKRAEAYDPHVALAQTRPLKLKEFRKETLQRHRQYQEEIKEMKQRVKTRPLLLEQVAQMNAKQMASRRYAEALRVCGVSEAFITSTAPKGQNRQNISRSSSSSDCHSTPRHRSAPSAEFSDNHAASTS